MYTNPKTGVQTTYRGKQFRRQVLGLYGAKHAGIGPIFLKTSGEL